ncbi:MAG TPA: hypothetical protein VGN09_22365 [Vicinamibacteria bacterium]
MWIPYGLPGLRVIVAALWLVAVDAIVPVGPEPLPRSTTPLWSMLSGPVTRHVPGPSRTAPRKPFTSGSVETRVRAARMAAVSMAGTN